MNNKRSFVEHFNNLVDGLVMLKKLELLEYEDIEIEHYLLMDDDEFMRSQSTTERSKIWSERIIWKAYKISRKYFLDDIESNDVISGMSGCDIYDMVEKLVLSGIGIIAEEWKYYKLTF